MIKKIGIENFRCVRELDLELEPLTALVGPNGSGKSAVLAALSTRYGINEQDGKRFEALPKRTWTLASGHVGSLSSGMPFSKELKDELVVPIRLDLDAMRRDVVVDPAGVLEPDGSNIANVIRSFTRREQNELASQLAALVPIVADVDLASVGAGRHRLRFLDRWKPGMWLTPDMVSDGTLLVTAFLTLQFQSPPPAVVTIEEPERGLHPYLLEQLVGFLRKLSRGELGRAPIQVVLATHSPELLEYLEPQEVRFLGRDPQDGSTTVRSVPHADPDWKRYFQEYRESLREAWLSGGLGGVPGL